MITTGEAHTPFISAWSKEALEKTGPTEEGRKEIKWSYADSPYCCYGDEFFSEVKELFSKRPAMTAGLSEQEWNAEYDSRLIAMESALARLDAEAFFGNGNA